MAGEGSAWALARRAEPCLGQGKSVLSRSSARRQLAVSLTAAPAGGFAIVLRKARHEGQHTVALPPEEGRARAHCFSLGAPKRRSWSYRRPERRTEARAFPAWSFRFSPVRAINRGYAIPGRRSPSRTLGQSKDRPGSAWENRTAHPLSGCPENHSRAGQLSARRGASGALRAIPTSELCSPKLFPPPKQGGSPRVSRGTIRQNIAVGSPHPELVEGWRNHATFMIAGKGLSERNRPAGSERRHRLFVRRICGPGGGL